MDAPIIFCHYGNSPYLQYVLEAARLFNKNKRVILLGDASNREIALKKGAEHFYFEQYAATEALSKFNEVYHHVAGEKHGKEFWTNFVFKRWFYVHAFIGQHGIKRFWHFDSDTIILTYLARQEPKYQSFDCTEQCNSICMNGYITSYDVVNRYVNTINDLFEDEAYLAEQKHDFETHPEFAFTEMRAYKAFRERSGIKTIALRKIIDGESYDECICLGQGYETYPFKLNTYFLKKIYYDGEGKIFFKHLDSGKMIKMNSLNLSWVPTYLFKRVMKVVKMRKASWTDLKVLDIQPSAFMRLKNYARKIKNKI